MEGTRKVLLKEIMDWVASIPEQGDVLHRNTYWIYGLPGIGKTSLAHSICAILHGREQASWSNFLPEGRPEFE
jgi:chromosomal replication initiation ATPase DnaA